MGLKVNLKQFKFLHMKKLFTLLICSSMLLSGCSNFSEMEPVDGICEIKFTFGVDNDNSKSRTTMPADGLSSSFESGDEIGVYVYNNETSLYSNIKYTYDGADWNSEQKIIVDADASVTCYAYYPYSESFNIENQDIAINNFADLYDNDFLFDEVNAEASANLISFVLEHKMSLLEFKLDKTGTPAMQVVLNNVKNTLALTSRNSFATNNESTGDVTMTCVDEANRIYRAFLPAQTIVNGTQYLTATIDGSPKTLTAAEDMLLTVGKRTIVDTNIYEANPNLIVDGDFEIENIPDWSKSNAAWIAKSKGSVGVINGNASLRLNLVKTSTEWAEAKQTIAVQSGRTYIFGFIGRIQTTNGESGTGENPNNSKVKMTIKDVDNPKTIYKEIECMSASNQSNEGEVTIPEGITSVQISFNTSYARAFAYIDDVYFKLKE